MLAPVGDEALLNSNENASGVSTSPSSISATSITISLMDAPSDGAVKISVPVAGSNVTSGLFATAA